MSRFICCFLTLVFLGPVVLAQGDATVELYGEGVHRFFAGDYLGAADMFSQAAGAGSEDPRVYYFRGLTQEMQGGDGQADYEVAARLEAEGPMAVNVGMALSRIQGATRTKIELARRAARINALQKKLSAPPQQLSPPPEPTIPPPPTDTADAGADLLDEGFRSQETTEDPLQPADQPALDESTDPFGDEPAPAPTAEATPSEPPAAEDPFGTDATDPFGTPPAGDASDPFGTPSGDAPATDPFGTDSGAADPFDTGDPFGTDT